MRLPFLAFALLLASCATTPHDDRMTFWQALESHCGMAYEGRLVSEDPRDADWQGKRMIAHWAECGDAPDTISIALHVEDGSAPGGWDRSRTWIVEAPPIILAVDPREHGYFTLRHDHRHADGTPDAVTMYGGATDPAANGPGVTGRAQDFPIDAETIALFRREGLDASLTNVWRIEVDPADARGARFAYQLTRRNDPTRLFRLEFDLTRPLPETPPPAWGHE